MGKCASVLCLVTLCGCTGNRLSLGLPQQRVPDRERVADRNEWSDVKIAPLQYRHVSDEPTHGPYRILISDQGHYCVVDATTYTMVQDGRLWECDWRVQRP